MRFLLALQFLTRVPVTVQGTVTEKDMARSMAWFPLVGLLLGLGMAAVHILASLILPAAVSDLLAITFLIVITGNMHGDGLMDTADGIFSDRPREGMLEIMKDSRVGSHGVMAGALAVLFRFILLGQIPGGGAKMLALILVPCLGRWAQIYGAAMYPYARAGAGGGIGNFTGQVGKREIIWSSVTALAAALVLFGLKDSLFDGAFQGSILTGVVPIGILTWLMQSGILAGVVLAGTLGLYRFLSGKLGGLTGDTYGTANECIEILALMILLVMFQY